MHRQRAHHEDVARIGVDHCELTGGQLAQLPIRYDAPQVTPRNQLKRARALIGRIEMKPKRNQATERFSHRLAVGFATTYSRTWHISMRRGDHSVLMGWDRPIGGRVLVEEGRINQDCWDAQEPFRERLDLRMPQGLSKYRN
jgi:hypothetical protein